MAYSKYDNYCYRVLDYSTRYPDLRAGQKFFNALSEFDPRLAHNVMGTNLDPFHNDEALPDFLEWCYAHMDRPENWEDIARKAFADE